MIVNCWFDLTVSELVKASLSEEHRRRRDMNSMLSLLPSPQGWSALFLRERLLFIIVTVATVAVATTWEPVLRDTGWVTYQHVLVSVRV